MKEITKDESDKKDVEIHEEENVDVNNAIGVNTTNCEEVYELDDEVEDSFMSVANDDYDMVET